MKTRYLSKLKTHLPTTCLLALAACAGTSSTGPVPEGHYRVQSGDNLYRIGLRFGQSAQTLAEWNGLSDPTKIEVGQVLRVRPKGAKQASASGTSSRPRSSNTDNARAVVPTNRLSLQWPVENGADRVVGQYDGGANKGIDIGGERGSPVKAAAAGKVLYAGEGLRGYGKLVLISHNSSTLTAYAHNDSIAVQKGQTVQAGQTVATMGSSDTDSVKLHFEVRINGKAVNPMSYLN